MDKLIGSRDNVGCDFKMRELKLAEAAPHIRSITVSEKDAQERMSAAALVNYQRTWVTLAGLDLCRCVHIDWSADPPGIARISPRSLMGPPNCSGMKHIGMRKVRLFKIAQWSKHTPNWYIAWLSFLGTHRGPNISQRFSHLGMQWRTGINESPQS